MIRPSVTLAELYPAGCVLSGRPSPRAARWLRGTPALRDFLAGETLAIAGAMPVLAGAGSTTPACLELMAEAGLPVPREIVPFADSASYLTLLAGLAGDGARLALSHAHAPGELPEEAYAVTRPLLCLLNNKRNLDGLVPAGHRPPARLLARAALDAGGAALARLPAVLKAAVDEPTGGGTAVRICASAGDVRLALADLGSCSEILVEEFVPHARSFNLQVAIPTGGDAHVLGVSEQVVTAEGRYRGNWLPPEHDPPLGADALSLAIARDAGARGYCGILGLDVAAGPGGSAIVFDLNFRLNGSTPALLLAASVRAATGASAIRYRTFEGHEGHAAALAAARRALRAGWFVPLNTFDPARSPESDARAWVSGLVLGADRFEVGRREEELRTGGLA